MDKFEMTKGKLIVKNCSDAMWLYFTFDTKLKYYNCINVKSCLTLAIILF
jgi:hypothetical protein